jgi:hypothetical protein
MAPAQKDKYLLSSKRVSQWKNIFGLGRNINYVIGPKIPKTKDDFVGEGQQQFTGLVLKWLKGSSLLLEMPRIIRMTDVIRTYFKNLIHIDGKNNLLTEDCLTLRALNSSQQRKIEFRWRPKTPVPWSDYVASQTSENWNFREE